MNCAIYPRFSPRHSVLQAAGGSSVAEAKTAAGRARRLKSTTGCRVASHFRLCVGTGNARYRVFLEGIW
jgi:hypothetical protein